MTTRIPWEQRRKSKFKCFCKHMPGHDLWVFQGRRPVLQAVPRPPDSHWRRACFTPRPRRKALICRILSYISRISEADLAKRSNWVSTSLGRGPWIWKPLSKMGLWHFPAGFLLVNLDMACYNGQAKSSSLVWQGRGLSYGGGID